jgi:hypothetical protein
MLMSSKPYKRISIAAFTLSAIFTASSFAMAPINVHAAGSSRSDDTVLLNTLGYTTGQSVLLTHMAVGTLADACVGNVYPADQATNFINTYIGITNGMKDQMSKLLAAGTLSEGDAKFIQSTIDVLVLVLKEAQNLKVYIVSRTNANAVAYDDSRKAALKEIKILLSIKD